jgi:site-specific recombinase XerD
MKINDFQQYVPDFLLHLRTEKNLSDHTYRAYACDLKQFLTFWHEHNSDTSTPPIENVKKAIKLFRSHLTEQKANKTTVARKISCFNSYERFLGSQNIILNLELVRPHIPLAQPKSLSIKEIHFLLDELTIQELPTQKPHRDKTILEFLYATGIRCSELINIRLAHITMEHRSIIIPDKRKETRTVFFSEQAQKQLQLYLEHERKLIDDQQEFLFLNYRYQPMTSRSIQRTCNMFGAFLSSKRTITPQLLRHSFALHLLDQGTDVKTVKHLLGFSSMASIEKYLR